MKQKIEKNKRILVLIIIILIIINIIIAISYVFKHFERTQAEKNVIFLDESLGEDVYSFREEIYNLKTDKKDRSLYDQQEKIDENIQRFTKKKYTLENPLVIYNAYNTNLLSCNVYFKTKKLSKIEYTVHIEGEEIPDYTNILYNEEGYSKDHKYQIIGLVPGYKNQVKLTAKTENGEVAGTKTISINVPKIDVEIPIVESNEGTSTKELENGLYALLGYNIGKTDDKWVQDSQAILLYDNYGTIRGIIPIKENMPDRIEFYEGYMYYNYSDSEIIKVNRLGKIEKSYDFEGYINHHDFILDKENKKIIFLVDDSKDLTTTEDKIVVKDLNTGNTDIIIDMKEILKELYQKLPAKQDWIHLNSVDVRKNDIIVSSKHLNSIICIENYIENPKLKYIIGDSDFYEGIYDEKIVYEPKGEFNLHSSQHYATYNENENESENEYYITFYNNNNVSMSTEVEWFDWKEKYTWAKDKKSYYYKYLVNEKEKTFELVDSVEVPFSGILSNAEVLENGNIQIASGVPSWFGEYDEEGNLIKEFTYECERYTYRITKYNFDKFWLEN